MKLSSSLGHFLDKLIDYAGLFPPAKLDIKPSLKNYAEYIQSTDKWMMSKFIIPVSRLDEISTDSMKKYSENFPLNLSLISDDICDDITYTSHQLMKLGWRIQEMLEIENDKEYNPSLMKEFESLRDYLLK